MTDPGRQVGIWVGIYPWVSGIYTWKVHFNGPCTCAPEAKTGAKEGSSDFVSPPPHPRPNSYIAVLTPSTPECKLFWE